MLRQPFPQSSILLVAALLLGTAVMAGCTAPIQYVHAPGGDDGTDYCARFASLARQDVNIDGSSTVFPIAEAWAERFGGCLRLDVVVGFVGTGAGFKKFCRGETQVTDASRPIKATETEDCRANNIVPYELEVAIDGLAIVVSRSNTFVNHLTVSELNRIWTANASKQANTWRDLRPEWPDHAIARFGPGTDSGTFDYFVEVVIHTFDGSASRGRSDYTPSEDDNVLVRGVEANGHSLGYFGLAYVQANEGKVRAVPIVQDTQDGGETTDPNAQPVAPTAENVESGTYRPLARPLFMYTNGKPADRLREFFLLGLTDQGQALVEEVGYVKLPASKRTQVLADLGFTA